MQKRLRVVPPFCHDVNDQTARDRGGELGHITRLGREWFLDSSEHARRLPNCLGAPESDKTSLGDIDETRCNVATDCCKRANSYTLKPLYCLDLGCAPNVIVLPHPLISPTDIEPSNALSG